MRHSNDIEGPGRHERRRAERIAATFPIELTYRDAPVDAELKDLSENGLCCTYPTAIDELTQVRLGLRLPGTDRSHSVDGAVVRCVKCRGDSPPRYEIAVYFTYLSDEARIDLRAFVNEHLASGGKQAGGTA